MRKKSAPVIYLSLEIALDSRLKTYAGGLGVLAGDILKSAASRQFPMVGISLLNRHGYFRQSIDSSGRQIINEDFSDPTAGLEKLDKKISVVIGNRDVKIGIWRTIIYGRDGFTVPVYLLDTNLEENIEEDRHLTNDLYGAGEIYRLKQEIILGRGGLLAARELGYKDFWKIHINEAHGALAAVELYNREEGNDTEQKIKAIKKKLVFTTHTPLFLNQDAFTEEIIKRYQPDFPKEILGRLVDDGKLSLMSLAVFLSGKINAVSKIHQRVFQTIFPARRIEAITNGVNSIFWTSPEFQELYDNYCPGWRKTPELLKKAKRLSGQEVWSAHQKAKRRLLNFVKNQTGEVLDEDILTIGFARRFTAYKRPLFLFSDLEKLCSLSRQERGLQIIYAGKAHPSDKVGQDLIFKLHQLKKELSADIKIIFLANYDLEIARLMTGGEIEMLFRKLPPEISKRHAEQDDFRVEELVSMVPNISADNIEVFSAALRGVFLSILYKREVGEAVFDDALRIMVRGVVIQMFKGEQI